MLDFPPDSRHEPPPLRCPTCGAQQTSSPECRRCRCDLRLYQAALDDRRRGKAQVLDCLAQGRFAAAVSAARHYQAQSPGREATRLLAVACLLAGRYGEALAAYDSLQPPRPPA